MRPTILLFFALASLALGADELEADLPGITVHAPRPILHLPSQPSEFQGEAVDINATTQVSLADAMRVSPSIVTRRPGGEGTPPVFLIRGQDPIENRFFLEGVPLNDAEFNQGNVSLLPLETLAQADVYAEGVPLFLGDDGLGGAVQFKLAPWSKTKAGSFSVRGGSYAYRRVSGDTETSVGIPLRLHLDYVESKENFEYFDDNGTPFNTDDDAFVTRENNRFSRVSALPRFGIYESPVHRVEMFSLDNYGQTEIPGPVDIPTVARLTDFSSLTALRYQGGRGGPFEADSNLFVRYHEQHLVNQDVTDSPALPDSNAKEWAVGGRAHFTVHALSFVTPEAVVGLTSDHYRIEASSAPDDTSLKTRLQIPVGVSTRLPLLGSALTLTPAVLAHYYQYALEGPSSFDGTAFAGPANRHFFLASPRVGLASQPVSWLRLRGTLGGYYRAPSLYELYGDPTGVTPSPSLTYERSTKEDAGVDLEWRRPVSWMTAVRLSYTFAASHARDLISYMQNSQQTRVATNIGSSFIRTHELSLEGRAAMGLTLRTGLALLHTENLSDSADQKGKVLPGRPDYRGEADLFYSRGRITATYGMTWTGPSYWDLANERRLSSTVEHHLSASFDTRGFGMVTLEGLNLTDITTANSTFGSQQTINNTTGYLGYPSPGRRVYVTWKYEL